MIVVFFAVGFLEVLSIAFRPVSLSFRLYGNISRARTCWKPWRTWFQHPAWARIVVGALLPVPFFISWNCWWAFIQGGGVHAPDRRVYGVDLHA